jgi:hypothetical protein
MLPEFPQQPSDFSALAHEADGIYRLHIVPPSTGRQIFEHAASGDAYSFGLALGLVQSLDRIRTAPPGSGAVCLVCPAILCADDPITFILTVANIDMPSTALGAALCPRCGALPNLHARVATALRRVWPDLRPISISNAVGHA